MRAAGTTLECSLGVACCSTIFVVLLAKCELQRNLLKSARAAREVALLEKRVTKLATLRKGSILAKAEDNVRKTSSESSRALGLRRRGSFSAKLSAGAALADRDTASLRTPSSKAEAAHAVAVTALKEARALKAKQEPY